MLAPAAIYLVLNRGPTAHGWSIPTATDIAFTLGILALLGERSPPGLRVFVAALAVVDDVLSVVTLAIFYPRSFDPVWLAVSAVLRRAAVHAQSLARVRDLAVRAGLGAAVVRAARRRASTPRWRASSWRCSCRRGPRPRPGPCSRRPRPRWPRWNMPRTRRRRRGARRPRLEQEPIWDWASRNLSAASARLLSPADRVELAVAPWSTYVVLPLFAFSATGIHLSIDLSQPGAARILAGVVLGLVVGKPLGVSVASWLAIKTGLAVAPDGVTTRQFLGAALLCGVGDTVALLMADRAFPLGPAARTSPRSVSCWARRPPHCWERWFFSPVRGPPPDRRPIEWRVDRPSRLSFRDERGREDRPHGRLSDDELAGSRPEHRRPVDLCVGR